MGEHHVAQVFGRVAQAGELSGRGLTGLQDGRGAVKEGPVERLLGAFDMPMPKPVSTSTSPAESVSASRQWLTARAGPPGPAPAGSISPIDPQLR